MTVHGNFYLFPVLNNSEWSHELSFDGLMILNNLGKKQCCMRKVPLEKMDLTTLTAKTLGLTLNLRSLNDRDVRELILNEKSLTILADKCSHETNLRNPPIHKNKSTYCIEVGGEFYPLSHLKTHITKQESLEYVLIANPTRYRIPVSSWTHLRTLKTSWNQTALRLASEVDTKTFAPCDLKVLLRRESSAIEADDLCNFCLALVALGICAFIYRFAFYRAPQ